MNSKKTVLVAAGICIVLLGLAFVNNNLEKNKKKPYERNTENSDTSETISETHDQTDSEPTTEESKKISIVSGDVGNNDEEKNWKNTAGDNIFNSDGVKVECLSVDVVEDTDIVKQTKYSAEYFKTGELPDPDFIEKITDMEAVFEQAPDYEKLYNSPVENEDDMNKLREMQEKNKDLLEENTKYIHPKTRYYFVKCRITNENEEAVDKVLSFYTQFVLSNKSQMWNIDNQVYFDKSIHMVGDDRADWFFLRTLEPAEVLECTLGFEVSDSYNGSVTLYIGEPPLTDELFDPDSYPDLVKLDNIPRER